MEKNFIGVVSAIAAFSGIAIGHILVRWLEFRVVRLWIPLGSFLALGFSFEVFSLNILNLYAKTAFGIFGFTLLWDAVELIRQQQRVRCGHAPANPCNARHRRFLEVTPSSATTIDYLRDETPNR
ncbi:MAG: DUF4491 family protein [Anaerolineales bacterium]|nr:DUF4491 family protein [Anaerolineales bacterium]